MLIAISGSQGAGKTTVLNALNSRGYNIIERKTSRSILADWNVTLQEVNNNRDLTLRFQDEIVARKVEDEAYASNTADLWFTERSFADLFTYAVVSLGKDNDNSEWLNSYYDTCKTYQQSYSVVCYIVGGLFQVQHDGVRGSNQHYARMVDLMMADTTKQITTYKKFMEVNDLEVNDRVDSIIEYYNRRYK